MSEFKLAIKTGFGLDEPIHEDWQGFSVSEIAFPGVCWISCNKQGLADFEKAWKKLSGVSLPGAGQFVSGKDGLSNVTIFDGGAGQWFVTGANTSALDSLSGVAAVTDQTGGWLCLRLEGSKTLTVLEKLCGIDLHPSVFPSGSCARTPFEGMAALIACEDSKDSRFLVLFQRSSSRSFLDHVRHAAQSSCALIEGSA